MGLGVIFALLNLVLYAFEIFLFVRAVCSWVPSFRESMVYRLAYKVTEPILSPIRDLLFKINWVRMCPIDISFLVVVFMVSGLMSVTSYLAYAF